MTTSLFGEETLPPLKNGKAPQTFEEMWADFDPRKEALEVEVLKDWEEDGVALKVLRYRIGIFKGKKATMAAVYGYPKGGSNLPGLVQAHGGGQYADYKACLTNAKRGYATISIAWAGRISAPGYTVNPEIVKLFWDGKTDDPEYKLTTDWGALDGYHAPFRFPRKRLPDGVQPEWVLDPVESPRNSLWFLWTLGARRALTFLERQPEIDKDRLGIYGHSMGGEITIITAAADRRVKAAAPSCGGVKGARAPDNKLKTAASAHPHISCPVIFLNPSNDFHGLIEDLQIAVKMIKSRNWRITSSPHRNHQDTAEYEVATQLWFDQLLKQSFKWPEMPKTQLNLKTDNGIPSFSVTPDASKQILSVDIFYTQHGHLYNVNRFWHYAKAKKAGNTWTADIPIMSTDKNLWVYANVLYPLEKPVTGAGYYYATYTTDRFNLSSVMSMVTPTQLKKAEVKATAKPSLVIETFEGDWEKEWFTYKPQDWARRTHKLYDEQWKAPPGARLAIEICSEQSNKMVIGIDQYAAEIQLKENSNWQHIVLSPEDFHDAAGKVMPDWNGLKELRLGAQETLKVKVNGKNKTLKLGADWQGEAPQFRNLRWIKDSKDG